MTAELSLSELEAFDSRARLGGRERRFCCPLCGGGKAVDRSHQSLSVNTDSGAWHCHRCGQQGLLREFQTRKNEWSKAERLPGPNGLRRIRRLPQASSLPPLGRMHPLDLPPAAPPPSAEDWGGTLLIGNRKHQAFPLVDNPYGRAGADYLLKRGIAPELAAAAGVRFCPLWYGRPAIVFPVHDEQGRLLAAQGRFVDGRTDPKNALPKTMSAGLISQGIFATPGAWDADTLILCEAPLDALSLAVCGSPALATCGSTMLPRWMRPRLAFRRVLLAFDADDAGDKAAAAWTEELTPFRSDITRLRPESEVHEPDGHSGKDWNELLTTAGRAWLEDWLNASLYDPFALKPSLPECLNSLQGASDVGFANLPYGPAAWPVVETRLRNQDRPQAKGFAQVRLSVNHALLLTWLRDAGGDHANSFGGAAYVRLREALFRQGIVGRAFADAFLLAALDGGIVQEFPTGGGGFWRLAVQAERENQRVSG